MTIQMSEPYFDEEEAKNLAEAVTTGWVSSSGHFIKDFEEQFSNYIGTRYGVAVSNGTAALHLALVALGIKQGDEVILPSLTSIACANAIRYTGAEPVFADANKDYWCVEPSSVEEKITKRTKAIMVVHIYGHPCDMDKIMAISKKYDIPVIEDCAEAHGAEYKGKKVGTFGLINCFSFYGNKIITTGEGGMCLTDSISLAEKMKIYRNQGTKPEYRNKYYYDLVGFNYRMTNMQAAIGVAQMKKLDYLISQKIRIAETYKKLLAGVDVVTAPCMNWAKNVYWYYSILVRSDRNELCEKLNEVGIETRPFFYPIHLLPMYKTDQQLPITENLGFRGINLPSSPKLTEAQMVEITDIIREFA